MKYVVLLLLTATLAHAQPTASGPDSARIVLDAALDAMQAKAYYSARVDWPAVRARAYAQTAGATAPADAYPAIREALAALGDGHSFLITREPEPPAITEAPAAPPPTRLVSGIVGRVLEGPDGRIGYVRVPYLQGNRETLRRAADSLLAAVRRVDAARPTGWIVDVRFNGGGNVWPMLAGLAPLLGDGVVGGSIGADGAREWMRIDGPAALYVTADTTQEVLRTAGTHRLSDPLAPVAVLTDSATASSAEAVALAFAGRSNSRRFGTATVGVSSSNEGTPLPDGSVLVLTTGLMTDRTGRAYGVRLEPDAFVADDPATPDDEAIGVARTWLLAAASASARPRLDQMRPEQHLAGGRLRIVNVYRAQALALAATAGQPADSVLARLTRDAYRPYADFWDGYVGGEDGFREWSRDALLGDASPLAARLDSVVALDLDGLFEAGAAWVEARTGHAPEGTWFLAFGPGYTDMGGLGGATMVADLSAVTLDASRIPDLLAHELVHQVHAPSVARGDDPDRRTVLDRIVTEGLASYASFVYAGGALTPAGALRYTEVEWTFALEHEAALAAAARPLLGLRYRPATDLVALRNASLVPGGPGAAGYFLGFRMVQAYVAAHGPDSWVEIVDLPVRDALRRSGYALLGDAGL